jgi:hypothetical protein
VASLSPIDTSGGLVSRAPTMIRPAVADRGGCEQSRHVGHEDRVYQLSAIELQEIQPLNDVSLLAGCRKLCGSLVKAQ